MRWPCRRWPPPPPATDAGDPREISDQLSEILRMLESTRPEREAQREVARQARATAEQLVARNHFGESIQRAMERRR
ncbi:MAG: hypothetical protein INR66_25835 [Gordonia polyisoprenivorans]|nr:hypothetical protein [Gordonia polyisoprenivorans]